jgi:hypothetical protein
LLLLSWVIYTAQNDLNQIITKIIIVLAITTTTITTTKNYYEINLKR